MGSDIKKPTVSTNIACLTALKTDSPSPQFLPAPLVACFLGQSRFSSWLSARLSDLLCAWKLALFAGASEQTCANPKATQIRARLAPFTYASFWHLRSPCEGSLLGTSFGSGHLPSRL